MKLVAFLQTWIATRERDDEGATMVEYGLVVAFIALIALVGVKLLGTALNTLFTSIATAL